MRLLVSVRSAAEVGAALAGGADIIDAKEPTRGGLGAVDPDTLEAIAGMVPAAIPLSVALGDFTAPAMVRTAIRRLSVVRDGGGELFLKLGFAGTASESLTGELLAAAIEAADRVDPAAGVVAVAYADWSVAASPPPDAVSRTAARMGAAGVLLDTSKKEGRDLFDWIPRPALASWVGDARGAGLMVALAGSLGAERLLLLRDLDPDVVGVRGAACEGGRLGRVSAERVGALRSALDSHPPGDEVPAKRQTTATSRLG